METPPGGGGGVLPGWPPQGWPWAGDWIFKHLRDKDPRPWHHPEVGRDCPLLDTLLPAPKLFGREPVTPRPEPASLWEGTEPSSPGSEAVINGLGEALALSTG